MRRSWLILSFAVLALSSAVGMAQEASFDCLKAADADRAADLLRSATYEAGRRARRGVRRLPAAAAGKGPRRRACRAAGLARPAAEAMRRTDERRGRGGAGRTLAGGALSRRDVPGSPGRSRLSGGAAAAHCRNSPSPGLFIPPACGRSSNRTRTKRLKPAPRIPLGACALGNRHIPVTLGDEGDFSAQGAAEGFPTWLSYRLLGKLPDGRDVASSGTVPAAPASSRRFTCCSARRPPATAKSCSRAN